MSCLPAVFYNILQGFKFFFEGIVNLINSAAILHLNNILVKLVPLVIYCRKNSTSQYKFWEPSSPVPPFCSPLMVGYGRVPVHGKFHQNKKKCNPSFLSTTSKKLNCHKFFLHFFTNSWICMLKHAPQFFIGAFLFCYWNNDKMIYHRPF